MMRELMNATKKIPVAKSFIKTHTWQSIRHRIALLKSDRTVVTFTGFFRLPIQFETLSGPVQDSILREGATLPLVTEKVHFYEWGDVHA